MQGPYWWFRLRKPKRLDSDNSINRSYIIIDDKNKWIKNGLATHKKQATIFSCLIFTLYP